MINQAFAQAASLPGIPQSQGAPGAEGQLVVFVLIFIVFYFLLIRPQQKRFKEHQNMVKGLTKGDKIVTGGGIIGTVIKIDGDEVLIDAGNGTQLTILKNSVSSKTGEKSSIRQEKVSVPKNVTAKKAAKKAVKKAPAKKAAKPTKKTKTAAKTKKK